MQKKRRKAEMPDDCFWHTSALGPAAGEGGLWLQSGIIWSLPAGLLVQGLIFLLQRQQGGVAAGGGGVGRHCELGGEAVQVSRATGLGAGAGEAFAAEGLHADDGADHAAVDIAVSGVHSPKDVAHALL